MKKIALVSGASSGMGRCMVTEIADRFPSLDEIWVTARREDKLNELAEEFPGRIRIFPGNLRKQEVVDGIALALEEEGAKICILVNAAGFGKIGREGVISSRQTAAMIEVNCIALTALTEAVLPASALQDPEFRVRSCLPAAAGICRLRRYESLRPVLQPGPRQGAEGPGRHRHRDLSRAGDRYRILRHRGGKAVHRRL